MIIIFNPILSLFEIISNASDKSEICIFTSFVIIQSPFEENQIDWICKANSLRCIIYHFKAIILISVQNTQYHGYFHGQYSMSIKEVMTSEY